MPSVDARQQRSNQALTQQEAAAILARYQELWNRAALSELLDGFSEDITVDFADLPTIRGKSELDQVIRAGLLASRRRSASSRATPSLDPGSGLD